MRSHFRTPGYTERNGISSLEACGVKVLQTPLQAENLRPVLMRKTYFAQQQPTGAGARFREESPAGLYSRRECWRWPSTTAMVKAGPDPGVAGVSCSCSPSLQPGLHGELRKEKSLLRKATVLQLYPGY